MESYDILVIMLSVALFFTLLVWIIAAVLIMQVVKKVKDTADVASEAANNVQEFTHKLKMVGDVSAIGSAISQAAKFFKNKKEEK